MRDEQPTSDGKGAIGNRAHSRYRLVIVRAPCLSAPLALAEHGDAAAIGVNTVGVDVIRADHPVDVDQALVAALRGDLLWRQLGAVDEAFRIALAKRDVAGGGSVGQGVW